MKIAVIQMVSSTQVPDNLRQARELLENAARSGAELAALPEYFCLLGQRDDDKLAVQEGFGDGPVQRFLADTARDLGLWIVGGTLPLTAEDASGDRVRNSTLVFGPDGHCVARYDKMHLFRFDNGQERYDESRVLEAGTAPARFELPSRDGHTWRIGLSICYDLRFPELYRLHAAAGVDLILVPSAFTETTGRAHWEVLLRARAIENLCWIAAPAQGGHHENGRRTWGHTLVADPWGELRAVRDQGAGVVLCDVDAASVDRCRRQLPALDHRVL
jgi:nitrilase